jgi:hypothetical protein
MLCPGGKCLQDCDASATCKTKCPGGGCDER